jgi:Ca2+-binding RTX toxin-like protein
MVAAALLPALAIADPTQITRGAFMGSYTLETAPGTTNTIGVSWAPDPNGGFDYVFSDAAGLVTGLFITCEPETGIEIRCSAPKSDFAGTPLKIEAGDGNDTVTVTRGPAAPHPRVSQRIFGGPGDDFLSTSFHQGRGGASRLNGESGNDRLSSGGGATLLGSAGVDKLLAKNGAPDWGINCGPGKDKKESAKRDKKDPQAVSC